MQHFIGCDVHTRNQVVAWIEAETGEIRKRRLEHAGEEVGKFYRQFARGTVVGIEATFPAYWFERLLGELGHELWVGDAARIRASDVRYQKTDDRDAEDILDLLRTGRFPRIWVPSLEERDLRQLLVHRMKQVRARTQVKNQLQALAISQGVCRKGKLWSAKGRKELESLALLPWAGRRRKELLETLDRLDEQIRELDRAVEEAGRGASGSGPVAHPSGSGDDGVEHDRACSQISCRRQQAPPNPALGKRAQKLRLTSCDTRALHLKAVRFGHELGT